MIRDILIMAKSNMWCGNFCVVGVEPNGRWVRLVSDNRGSPLSSEHMRYKNTKNICRPLDVVRLETIMHLPYRNHQEDYIISNFQWLMLGRTDLEGVLKYHKAEEHDYVFGNTSDFITAEEFVKFQFNYSIMLIRVHNLLIKSTVKNGELKCKADFQYNNRQYRYMRITDPEFDLSEGFSGGEVLMYKEAHLVVSMPSRPYKQNDKYYKFIAKIFTE